MDNHEEMGLHSYIKILEKNGIKWSVEQMAKAEVDDLDDQCIIALIFGIIVQIDLVRGHCLHS